MELTFTYLGAVDSAELRGDKIEGVWGAVLKKSIATPTVEEFVNVAPTPAEILKFTQKFGPLQRDGGGRRFSFDLANWRKLQRRTQASWIQHSASTLQLTPGIKLQGQILKSAGLAVTIVAGRALANVPSLIELFELQMDSYDSGQIRVCVNPTCQSGKRFFIAPGKRKYCGGQCQHWGEKQTKRKWWNDNRKH